GKDESVIPFLKPEVRWFRTGAPRVASPGNLAAVLRMARYLAAIRPDVIHLQSGVIWELALKYFLPRTPVVTTLHDVVNHPSHSRAVLTPQRLLNHALREADVVMVHAPRLKTFLEEDRRAILGGRPVRVIPMGIMSRYGVGEATVEPKGAHILLFGTIDAWKGVEVLVQAEPLVRSRIPGVKTIIAGCCFNPPYYEKLIGREQSIERRFVRQTDEQVRALFHWADVLVLPYIEASQSAVLQTGLAFGIPPVVTDVGGLPDVIRDEENGLVVRPGRADQLADAIVRMLTDLPLREKVIRNLVRERDKVYNWDRIAVQLMDMYEMVLRKK
ncbi:MAG: glycosyltransferase family 4 protein, partial [Lentisphaerota bacterium]